MSKGRIAVIGAGPTIGLVVARALLQTGHPVEIVSDREYVQREIERAKQNELFAHESGKRVRGREFQERINDIQRRKAQEMSERNARRAFNRMRARER